MTVPQHEIRQARVVYTIVGGNVLHELPLRCIVSFRQACKIFGGVGLGTLWVANGDQRAVLVLASVEP